MAKITKEFMILLREMESKKPLKDYPDDHADFIKLRRMLELDDTGAEIKVFYLRTERIDKQLKKMNLSYRDFSGMIGKHPAYYERLRKPLHRRVTKDTALEISKTIGLDFEKIIDRYKL